MVISVVIRTYNESKHLGALLQRIHGQRLADHTVEIVVVDSGSSDSTVEIAQMHGTRVVNILKSEFTFGRSLNIGCEHALGDVLVFISGHCIPANESWLQNLVGPILDGRAAYSYGRQIGDESTLYSEHQLFKKYFPGESKIPQEGFFVNNANSAIAASVWRRFRFNEQLTGLEDMDMGKRIVAGGFHVAYCADSSVFHLHSESWRQIKLRYEREAIALREIMPEIHITFGDFARFFVSAVLLDCGVALQERVLHRVLKGIVVFRLMQFWGSYRGNHAHRVLSKQAKYRYFYPR